MSSVGESEETKSYFRKVCSTNTINILWNLLKISNSHCKLIPKGIERNTVPKENRQDLESPCEEEVNVKLVKEMCNFKTPHLIYFILLLFLYS